CIARYLSFFFFQAEDGIRDFHVTGVQTCALPILKDYAITKNPGSYNSQVGVPLSVWRIQPNDELCLFEAGISQPGEMARLERIKSEERRVGKECRSRSSREQQKNREEKDRHTDRH